MKSDQSLPPGAGFVIFSGDLEWTILVETPRGNLGFPKGKLKKSEDVFRSALRELKEETGLTEDDIVILKGCVVDEKSRQGDLCARYYVAYCEKDDHEELSFDPDELDTVEWYNCQNVYSLKSIKQRRKDVLAEARDYALGILQKSNSIT